MRVTGACSTGQVRRTTRRHPLPPADLLAIWDYRNDSPERRQALMADGWSLWGLARDLGDALRAAGGAR